MGFAYLRFGCRAPPVRTRRDVVLLDFFADAMDRDVSQRTRSHLKASYSSSVGSNSLRGGAAVIDGNLDIEPGKADEGIAILKTWLDR